MRREREGRGRGEEGREEGVGGRGGREAAWRKIGLGLGMRGGDRGGVTPGESLNNQYLQEEAQ